MLVVMCTALVGAGCQPLVCGTTSGDALRLDWRQAAAMAAGSGRALMAS